MTAMLLKSKSRANLTPFENMAKTFGVSVEYIDYPQKANYNRGYGALKGQIKMSEDFDKPLDDFKEYME